MALGEVKPIVENKLVEAGDSGLARLSAYVSNPEHSPDDPRLNIFLQSLPDSELRTELLYTSHFFILPTSLSFDLLTKLKPLMKKMEVVFL